MTSISRTLTIQWAGLAQSTRILLCFQKINHNELVMDQTHVAWKVIDCRPGSGTATITYSGRIGFAQSEVDSGNIVKGIVFQEVPLGSLSRLETSSDNLNVWGEPKKDSRYGTLIKAKNATSMRQAMSVGTLTSDRTGYTTYEPMFYWNGLGSNMTIEADVHPTLLAYVGLQYKQSELMNADLTDESPIYTQNLARLGTNTTLRLSEKDQGGFQLVPA